MTDIAYGMKTRVDADLEEAETRVRAALAGEGFGVLTEIDVAATLEAKLGVERASYRILGACNPQLADRALAAETDIGLLLPCNVVVYDDGDGSIVGILDPATMSTITDNPDLAPIVAEARERLERVLAVVAAG